MDNKLKKTADNNSNVDAKTTTPDDVETYFQLKKMKKWLDVNGTHENVGVYDDEGGPLSYGDGHCGWNR